MSDYAPMIGEPQPPVLFNDFWGETIPQFALDLGFEDHSWHNDAGAFMHWQVPNGRLVLFIGNDDTKHQLDFTHGLYLGPYLEELLQEDMDNDVTLIITDDINVLRRATLVAYTMLKLGATRHEVYNKVANPRSW